MEKCYETCSKKIVILLLLLPLFCYSQYTYDFTIIRDVEDSIQQAINYDNYIDTIEIDGNRTFNIKNISVSIDMYNLADSSVFDPAEYMISIQDSLSNVLRIDNYLEVNPQSYFNFDLTSKNNFNNINVNRFYTSFGSNKYLVFNYFLRVKTLPSQSVNIHIHTIITGTYKNL